MMKSMLVFLVIGLLVVSTAQAGSLPQSSKPTPPVLVPAPKISIDVSPHNPPVVLPASGGTFAYTIQVTNISQWSGFFDVWTTYTLPDGSVSDPLYGPEQFMQPAQWTSQSGTLLETIDPGMPAGTYTYNVYAGDYPDQRWSSDNFTFEKQSATPGWYAQSSGTTDVLSGVDFIDPNTGWVVGQNTVLHTTDGGDNWFEQPTPTYYPYNAVDFVDEDEGWVVGGFGTILHTIDSGQNWATQDSGYNTGAYAWSDVQFFDKDQGWAVGGYNGSFGQTGGIIVYTNDGGANWQTQFYQDNFSPLAAVSFVDANHGWAVNGRYTILHTDNGGLTWTSQILDQAYFLADVFFIDTSHGWIVDKYNHLILLTTDGGSTWETVGVSEPTYLDAIYFIDANTGWLVGGDNYAGGILKTTDGGLTWQTQFTGDLIIFGLDFTDAFNGWAVGWTGLILHTETGGD